MYISAMPQWTIRNVISNQEKVTDRLCLEKEEDVRLQDAASKAGLQLV